MDYEEMCVHESRALIADATMFPNVIVPGIYQSRARINLDSDMFYDVGTCCIICLSHSVRLDNIVF